MATLPPLTIRKPETLATRLQSMEEESLSAVVSEGSIRAESLARINGRQVAVTVTSSVKPGRVYTQFYIDGKRTAKVRVPSILLSVS